MAGYDTVFAELGSNHSTTQQIAFCRGAANMQGKDWGATITWEYDNLPIWGCSGNLAAYTAGAKYVIIFNYPRFPEANPYGILNEDYFNLE
jgi:hypothetical protein